MKKFMLTKRAAVALIMLAGCLWGMTGLFIKQLNAMGITSLPITVMRALLTALCMFVYVLLTNSKLLTVRLKDLWCFFGTGVVSLLCFNYCYFTTIETSGMGVAATLLYTSPAFVAVLSTWLFKEKFTRYTALAIGLTFAGALFVSGIVTGDGVLSPAGLLLGVGAGFFYGLYSIFTRYALARGYTSATITLYTFLFTTVGGLFVLDYEQTATALAARPVELPVFLLVYALVTTVIPYTLYNMGLTKVDNSTASVVSAIELVSAAGFGLFLHQIPDAYGIFGIVLVLSAVAVSNLSQKTKVKE